MDINEGERLLRDASQDTNFRAAHVELANWTRDNAAELLARAREWDELRVSLHKCVRAVEESNFVGTRRPELIGIIVSVRTLLTRIAKREGKR